MKMAMMQSTNHDRDAYAHANKYDKNMHKHNVVLKERIAPKTPSGNKASTGHLPSMFQKHSKGSHSSNKSAGRRILCDIARVNSARSNVSDACRHCPMATVVQR